MPLPEAPALQLSVLREGEAVPTEAAMGVAAAALVLLEIERRVERRKLREALPAQGRQETDAGAGKLCAR